MRNLSKKIHCSQERIVRIEMITIFLLIDSITIMFCLRSNISRPLYYIFIFLAFLLLRRHTHTIRDTRVSVWRTEKNLSNPRFSEQFFFSIVQHFHRCSSKYFTHRLTYVRGTTALAHGRLRHTQKICNTQSKIVERSNRTQKSHYFTWHQRVLLGCVYHSLHFFSSSFIRFCSRIAITGIEKRNQNYI